MDRREFWETLGYTYMEIVFAGGEEDKYGYFEQDLRFKKSLERVMERFKRTLSKYDHLLTKELENKVKTIIKEATNNYVYDDEADTMLLIGTISAFEDYYEDVS